MLVTTIPIKKLRTFQARTIFYNEIFNGLFNVLQTEHDPKILVNKNCYNIIVKNDVIITASSAGPSLGTVQCNCKLYRSVAVI
jgi:hypothetical protein